MRVLVTGGSGYIGSHTVQALLRSRHDVTIADVREPAPALAESGPRWACVDVLDAAGLDVELREGSYDAVVHLAALKSVGASLEDPGAYFAVNVGGTRNVLDAMARHGVRRLVFSSSAAVYGTPDHLPVTESTPTVPENPYGESKLLAERMLPWYELAHGIRFVALRYFNAGGAAADGSIGEDWRGAVNLLPVAIEAALGRGPAVHVFGGDYPTPDGTPIRDYVHVVDLAEAHVRALEVLAGGGRSTTLNLGTGARTSVAEILAAIERATGAPVPHVLGSRRPGDPAAVWADRTRAADELGWTASRNLDEIVGSAVAWHRTAVLEGAAPAGSQ